MKTLSTKFSHLLFLFAALFLCAPFAFAQDEPEATEPEAPYVYVTNIVAQQRYPWNGLVDIDYEVVASDPDADVWVWAQGFDNDMNVSMAPRALSGDGVNAPVKPGPHRMTWDVSTDYPNFAASSFTVKMSALTGGAPYMVIDISGGVDAISYPITYLSAIPEGGWSTEYKTTKIVLRLCPPGTFMMGSPTDELGNRGYWDVPETRHQVTLTKPFYIGIFEITQKQYQMVMGSNPSNYKGDTRPVEYVSYNTIRGSVNGAAWPGHNQVEANSFMGRIRSKANVLADLPTDAQWEYACRAGTSTALNSGKNLTGTSTCTNVAEVGRYNKNRNSTVGGYSEHTSVGCYLPNAWGIFDMHGNVGEWCLDWYNRDLGSGSVTDPIGPTSGYNGSRVLRGGAWGNEAQDCRSATRYPHYMNPSSYSDYYGFRLVVTPVE